MQPGSELTTTYDDLGRKDLGPAKQSQILGNLSRISHAMGLGFLSALVRRNDTSVGGGFYRFLEEELNQPVAPEDRATFIDVETHFLHEKAVPLIRLLRFVANEVSRKGPPISHRPALSTGDPAQLAKPGAKDNSTAP